MWAISLKVDHPQADSSVVLATAFIITDHGSAYLRIKRLLFIYLVIIEVISVRQSEAYLAETELTWLNFLKPYTNIQQTISAKLESTQGISTIKKRINLANKEKARPGAAITSACKVVQSTEYLMSYQVLCHLGRLLHHL